MVSIHTKTSIFSDSTYLVRKGKGLTNFRLFCCANPNPINADNAPRTKYDVVFLIFMLNSLGKDYVAKGKEVIYLHIKNPKNNPKNTTNFGKQPAELSLNESGDAKPLDLPALPLLVRTYGKY
jgi:hypothetical protein